jgi:hypothetical protein
MIIFSDFLEIEYVGEEGWWNRSERVGWKKLSWLKWWGSFLQRKRRG